MILYYILYHYYDKSMDLWDYDKVGRYGKGPYKNVDGRLEDG